MIRCLDKDRRRRLHDIADARIEMRTYISWCFPRIRGDSGPPEQRHGRFALSIGDRLAFVALSLSALRCTCGAAHRRASRA